MKSGQLGSILCATGYRKQPVYGLPQFEYRHAESGLEIRLPAPDDLEVPYAMVMGVRRFLSDAGQMTPEVFDRLTAAAV
ncbi:MAG: hypothetical protein AB7K09_24290 [Planctomycetota bacterium]